jgi:hypothetical protein
VIRVRRLLQGDAVPYEESVRVQDLVELLGLVHLHPACTGLRLADERATDEERKTELFLGETGFVPSVPEFGAEEGARGGGRVEFLGHRYDNSL